MIRITSGSTGEPTIIRRTVPEEALLRAFRFRAMRDFGLRLPDRRVGIVLVRPEDHRAPWIGLRIYRAVTQLRTVRIHCLLEPAAIVRALREIRPRGQARDRRPGIEAFLLANVKTNAWSFAEVARQYGHLFFRHDTGQGIVPFNMGCLKYGKFSAAFFGESRAEVLRLHAEVLA